MFFLAKKTFLHLILILNSNKMYNLLIIDTQPIFPASKKIIFKTLEEIYVANSDGMQIVFLEYWANNFGKDQETTSLLLKAAINKSIIKKYTQDGSKEVVNYFFKLFGYVPELRVCGVNTDQCVFDTVKGISKKTSNKIAVVSKACHSDLDHKSGIFKIKKLKNTIVI